MGATTPITKEAAPRAAGEGPLPEGGRARWHLREISEEAAAALGHECGLGLPAARVLWGRGYRDLAAVKHFLNPGLSDLHDPFRLLGMDAAVTRLLQAIERKERILLYGDYDVDGTSSVVVLKKTIALLGHEAGFHVPDRLKDGYGMHPAVIEQAAKSGVQLIVSVDTGIRAREAAQAARAHGTDLIITDHHLPEDTLPEATAILNPNQPGCDYPNKQLCGAGVTFKLVQALMQRAGWPEDKAARFSDSFLVLTAIATVADVVPLTGENRVIVRRGLEGLRRTKNIGLRALLKTAGFAPGDALGTTDVGFRVAPRINAAGRMSNARDVIELFLTNDEVRAAAIAEQLHHLNEERRQTEEAILEQARKQDETGGVGLVFSAAGWHRGVLGIAASRLVEQFHRPCLVLSEDPETGLAQGSGRSISGFHLLEALETMRDLMTRFGGHQYAVGLTLSLDRLGELRKRFDSHARQTLTEELLSRSYVVDAEIRLREIHDESVDEVLRLAPFGLGNPAPVYLLRGVELREPPLVMKEKHLRLSIMADGLRGRVTAWRFAERVEELQPGLRLDLLVKFREDAYSRDRGYAPWAMELLDVRPA